MGAILGWNALLPSRNLTCSVPSFDTTTGAIDVCTPCGDPRQADEIPRSLGRKIDRFSALAILAAKPLVDLLPAGFDPARVGVFIGNMLGGWAYGETELKNLVDRGPDAVHPFQATAWFPAAAQGEMTLRYQLQGISKTVSGGWLCGIEALMVANDALFMHSIDFAIAGAAESLVSSFALWGLGRNDQRKTYGEGAALLLLGREAGGVGSIDVDPLGFDLDLSADGDDFTTESPRLGQIQADIHVPGVGPVASVIEALKLITTNSTSETLVFRGASQSYQVTVRRASIE